ncbi:hypothetical protein AB0912_06335 [Streptomyces sp. NPDC007084]|uniref:hypothetical protein n=1 Tax=Streptomyces sp. NPDC007084 TaxID=3154313 RepID=UPI003456535C
MEVFGVVAMVAVLLLPSLRKLLDSVAFRNRARGKAEIIRAERAVGDTRQERSAVDGREGVRVREDERMWEGVRERGNVRKQAAVRKREKGEARG